MSHSPSRSRFFVVAVFAALACLMETVAGGADANKVASELDGTWKLVSVEQEGEEMERDDDVRWVIQDGKVLFAGEPLAAMLIYAASTPKGIDLSFDIPKNHYEGVYVLDKDKVLDKVLDKDELKICLNTTTTGPKDRPGDFATRGKTNLRVLRFERLASSEAGFGTFRGYVGMALAVENDTVVIQDVLENSPAQKAGLRLGDVVVSVGGQAARELRATVDSVRRQTPGSELAVRVLRDGKDKEVTVRVGVFPFSLLGILG